MTSLPKDTLIVIVGLHGSGKTTVASQFSQRGSGKIATGSVIRAEARNRGLPPTWHNLSRISLEFFQERQHTIIPSLEPEIRALLKSRSSVAIDGVKTPLEVAQLKLISPNCFTLAVLSSPRIRYTRLQSRGRPDDAPDSESLKERDEREIYHGLGLVISRSDFFAVNDGPRSELERQVESIISELEQLAKSGSSP